ncbi:MAG TPA: DNA mismatch repair protein [Polyangiaceae bacterium]|nr:DNA mismatch repair protein [Polyangiaceae bacterium]
MPTVPDLLFPEPSVRIRHRELSDALTFAFATGGATLGPVLARTSVGDSDFSPDCFARDLFLKDFVHDCLALAIAGEPRELNEGYLHRVLTHPPRDRATVEHRHAVFRELTDPRLRARVEHAWVALDQLRKNLEATPLARVNPIHRRLEILRQFKAIIEYLAHGFEGCTSALRLVHDFASSVLDSSGWADLCVVLDHEDHFARIDLSIRIGYDGQIRALEIVRAEENRENPLHQSQLRRLWDHFIAFLRGHAFREREIIGRLVEQVFDGVEPALLLCFQLMTDCEFYLVGLGLEAESKARALTVCLPELLPSDPAERTVLRRLFNPFLFAEDRPPVPCDLELAGSSLVIVTGPNSGGKTRLLQAVALAQLLGQVGLPVPAERARLVWTDGIFVSLVQEVASDAREGRLGTELLRIRRLFETLSCNSLVILDELCSGTNPSEGEEIFELVVELLEQLAPRAMITTHFLQFAGRLAQELPVAGLTFLQAELDDHFHPTFQFVPGVARTSLAQQTAERLGVTRESLAALVKQRCAEHARRHEPQAR